MNGERSWKILAAGALLAAAVALGAALRRGGPIYGEVQAGGGGAGSIIAITSDNNSTTQRLYIIDTGQKVLLVYQSTPPGDSDLKFVYGRTFNYDAELATYGEIKFNRTGYDVNEMKRELDAIKKRTGGG